MVDDVAEKKLAMIDAHVSQVYEWLPWHDGRLDQVPLDPKSRMNWLRVSLAGELTPAVRESLARWYGPETAKSIRQAEAFEICEYGCQPGEKELRRLFPFFPDTLG